MPLSGAARLFWGLAGLSLVLYLLRGFNVLALPGAWFMGLGLVTFFVGLLALGVSIRRRY
ncbi:hypothetical protein RIF25_03095 [Thermosynechococcaceae cyanobacterium BACA0444]|uniref:Uncharacterized protein n=1 Tax=Pseudocalidococcus azoricus BACA0444 TaxID=2918990 RepID=A0AAE4FPC1_9CYAN|nr:hypothetical protein [Pseudocalidococcus azoricus]MDS3859788.1 hypothetical protein [Pseudocalidococcus azoricus BACA0444]